MTTANLQFAWVIKIDFKLKISPYTVTSRYFSVSNYEENELYSGQSYKAHGLLRSIDGLGSSAEDVLPSERTGTITLDNTRGTVGHNLRFSDWLDKEEIVAQPVTVYYLRLDVDDKGGAPDTSLQTEFTGVVSEARLDVGSNSIRLNVISLTFGVFAPQYQITASGNPNAPSRSLGQYLPIIFGQAVVLAYPLSAVNLSQPLYAYATTTAFVTGNLETIYSKGGKGQYGAITSTSNPSTAIITYTDGTTTASIISRNQAYAYEIDSTVNGYCITQFEIKCIGWNIPAGTFSGDLTVSIFNSDDITGGPGSELGKCRVVKNDYASSMRGSGEYWITGTFNKVVPLINTNKYFLVVNESYSATDQVRMSYPDINDATITDTQDKWNEWDANSTNGTAKNWKFVGSSSDHLHYKLYAVGFANTFGSHGYSYLTLSQKNALSSPTAYTNPDLARMDLIVKVNGLKDRTDSSDSDITGSPDTDLGTSVAWAVKALLDQGVDNGFGYTPTYDTDITTFNAATVTVTDYPRRIDGATRGRVLARDICRAILTASKGKLVSMRNGEVAVWAYGYETSPSVIISEADCVLKDIDVRGVETVVNHVKLAYSETAIPLNIEDIQTGQPRSFEQALDWDQDTSVETGVWSDDSFNLYGEKVLNESYIQLPWIREQASAEFFAKSTMTVSRQPRKSIDIEVPFIERGYDSLELMSLVNFTHIDMPNQYGTSADGVTPFPVLNGVANTNVNSGFMWHEAKNYVCRIVRRKVNHNVDKNEMPTLDLTLEVLDNPMEIR